MKTLIGIDADFAGTGQPEGASRLKPLTEQISSQPFSKLELCRQVEPGLRDNREYFELLDEDGEVLLRQ